MFAQRLDEAQKNVESRLSEILRTQPRNVPPRLDDAMRHAVLGGGKRFRPFLVLETARLYGVDADRAVETAAALELVHCYSLVHDDLPSMDNDTLRRGLPTVWAAFDEWTAVLAGDALLTLAFEVAAAPRAHADPAVRAELVACLARAAGPAGMVGGQMVDLVAEKLGEPAAPTLAHVGTLQAMKTGALIRFACEAGAILGKADAADRRALARFGDALGLVFQIADDLLDAEGDPVVVGKAVAKDAVVGKATLVSLLGIAGAREKLASAEADAIAALERFGASADVLVEAARFAAQREK